MFCSNCGKQLPDNAKFCPDCGQPIIIPETTYVSEPEPEPVPVAAPEPVKEPEPVRAPEPVRVPDPVKENEPVDMPMFVPAPEPVVPEENRPLSPWAYFGYSLLFSIPFIGFILLIVLSFAGRNVNRKNFARSYWCWALLVIALILIAIVILVTGVLRGATETVAAWLSGIGLGWLAKLIS